MVGERDKKRIVILDGTGAQGTLKEGDDIPEKFAQIKNVPEASGEPLSVEAMADYLRALTAGSVNPSQRNVFPGPRPDALISSHNADGTPAEVVSPRDSAAGVRSVFAAHELLEELGVYGQTFDSETLKTLRDPNVGLHDVLRSIVGSPQIVLNKRDGSPQNASAGMASVKTPEGATGLQQKISNVLKVNRFNPSGKTPFVEANSSANDIDSRPIGRAQTAMGAYDNKPVDETTGITYEQMKKLGLALMLRATGEFIGRDGDPTDAGIGLGALIPGEAQLAATLLDRKSMWASDLTSDQGAPPGLGKGGARFGLDSDIALDDGEGSFGNLNTFIEPFNGFAPVGMTALAAAMVVVATGLVKLFTELLGGPGVSSTSTSNVSERTIRPMGSSIAQSDAIGFAASTFGIATVTHDYGTCVDRGIDVFFGFDGVSFQRVTTSPGYYAVMIRAIVRSSARIVREVVEAFTNNPNPISAIQALLGIVDVIKSSKIIGFMNVCAVLGDNVLTMEDQGFLGLGGLGLASDAGSLPRGGKVSIVDRLVDNAASHVMKSRADANSPALAWRTSSTPSSYLIPASLIDAAKKTSQGALSIDPQAAAGGMAAWDLNTLPRIPADNVRLIEDELDSEYVPFYFHDLRTNEIVSFHAFLASVTDSFSANYGRDKYYGRVDPVMIYSDTDRTINLSFHIASTNEDDFDAMWWKINKLTTLLYPQWSRGRKLEVGADAFIQPFSQIPTSSPVTRLRLGDVFRSNYSKFSLARLFGLGSADFNLAGSTAEEGEKTYNALNDKLHEIDQSITRQRKDPAHAGILEDSGYNEGDDAILKPQKGLHLDGGIIPTFESPPLATTNDVAVTVGGLFFLDVDGVRTTFYRVTMKEPPHGMDDGPYIVTHSELRPDLVAARRRQDELEAEHTTAAELEAVEKFFDAENNAIVRSFESVRGRGLAGVVTSMSFDWYTPTWETARINARAPQWCLVTMAFQPIHDIAPGIGVDGDNRAPIYPVGDVASKMAGDPYDDGKNREKFNDTRAEIYKNIKKQGF